MSLTANISQGGNTRDFDVGFDTATTASDQLRMVHKPSQASVDNNAYGTILSVRY